MYGACVRDNVDGIDSDQELHLGFSVQLDGRISCGIRVVDARS